MAAFALVAHRVSPTNTRLGPILSPGQALARLRPGDIALGRLDVLETLDGIEPGLWALDRLAASGVHVRNGRATLLAAHDKLATARALGLFGVPHPTTVHIGPGLPPPDLPLPIVLKPRFGSWGRDVVRCDDESSVRRALQVFGQRAWYQATGALAQELIPSQGHDLRIVVARGHVVGAVRRVARAGEWRTNVALGARREPVIPPRAACETAIAAAAAIDGDLVGVDLLPDGLGSWVVLEVNGAVDFTNAYSLGPDIYSSVIDHLGVVEEAPAGFTAEAAGLDVLA